MKRLTSSWWCHFSADAWKGRPSRRKKVSMVGSLRMYILSVHFLSYSLFCVQPWGDKPSSTALLPPWCTNDGDPVATNQILWNHEPKRVFSSLCFVSVGYYFKGTAKWVQGLKTDFIPLSGEPFHHTDPFPLMLWLPRVFNRHKEGCNRHTACAASWWLTR